MTDYDINDDDLPTFSPRDVMRRLAELEHNALHHQHNLFPGDTNTSKAFTLAAHTQPPAPALDEAEKWEEWVALSGRFGGRFSIADMQMIVADACASGLAAPADRAVCEEAAQRERDRIVQEIRDYTGAENWRVVANWIASGANAHKDAAACCRGRGGAGGRR